MQKHGEPVNTGCARKGANRGMLSMLYNIYANSVPS